MDRVSPTFRFTGFMGSLESQCCFVVVQCLLKSWYCEPCSMQYSKCVAVGNVLTTVYLNLFFVAYCLGITCIINKSTVEQHVFSCGLNSFELQNSEFVLCKREFVCSCCTSFACIFAIWIALAVTFVFTFGVC